MNAGGDMGANWAYAAKHRNNTGKNTGAKTAWILDLRRFS